MNGQYELQAALDRDAQPKRENCQSCDGARFAIWYDPIAQGRHVECENCGAVFFL